MNLNWRMLLNKQEPDIHMKDVEILLRGFGLLLDSSNYRPSMTRFLNQFSKNSRNFKEDSLSFFEKIFEKFCEQTYIMNPNIFVAKTGKFSITIFESIFVTLCEDSAKNENLDIKLTTIDKVEKMKLDEEFLKTTQSDTVSKINIENRLRIAKEILL